MDWLKTRVMYVDTENEDIAITGDKKENKIGIFLFRELIPIIFLAYVIGVITSRPAIRFFLWLSGFVPQ